MGDIRQRIDGTAADFAREAAEDDPDDLPPVETDVNDLEAALNPDEQFIEQSSVDDPIEPDLELEEGRAGD